MLRSAALASSVVASMPTVLPLTSPHPPTAAASTGTRPGAFRHRSGDACARSSNDPAARLAAPTRETRAAQRNRWFRQARHTRYPDKVESERALDINEGLASYTQTALAAPSEADAIARALELLADAEDGDSFVRTFTYPSGPEYGLLLDASSRGWTRTVRGSDDPVVLLMRALGVQSVADAAAAAARYGGAELRAAEEQREQQRQARIAELRRRFVDGPVFVMPGGGGGLSNSMGAVVIPDAGTVYFNPYRMSGPWGTLEAEKGVLEARVLVLEVLPVPLCVRCLCAWHLGHLEPAL
jgi:hypothetical protein